MPRAPRRWEPKVPRRHRWNLYHSNYSSSSRRTLATCHRLLLRPKLQLVVVLNLRRPSLPCRTRVRKVRTQFLSWVRRARSSATYYPRNYPWPIILQQTHNLPILCPHHYSECFLRFIHGLGGCSIHRNHSHTILHNK